VLPKDYTPAVHQIEYTLCAEVLRLPFIAALWLVALSRKPPLISHHHRRASAGRRSSIVSLEAPKQITQNSRGTHINTALQAPFD